MRKKVREAIARTGYVPNILAGGLASARSRLVAAVVPTISGPVFLQTIQSLTEALAERGYQLMLGQSGYVGNREDALLGAIIGRRPDGIVLTGIMHSAEGRRRLLAAGIPVVETWDLTPTPIDMLVGFSHEEVGRAVAEFLHAKGRRRLAVVAGGRRARAAAPGAFEAAARALGLRRGARRRRAGADDAAQRPRGAGRADARPRRIDAVFCSSDLLALGVMTEAQAAGIAVPERLAVVGFGDLEFAADLHPALTTVRIDGARDRPPGGAVHRRPRRGPRGRAARRRHRLLDRRARDDLSRVNPDSSGLLTIWIGSATIAISRLVALPSFRCRDPIDIQLWRHYP